MFHVRKSPFLTAAVLLLLLRSSHQHTHTRAISDSAPIIRCGKEEDSLRPNLYARTVHSERCVRALHDPIICGGSSSSSSPTTTGQKKREFEGNRQTATVRCTATISTLLRQCVTNHFGHGPCPHRVPPSSECRGTGYESLL